ncbi:MAG: hypothetical protein FJ398_16715 [Verrucomicrobia bacterium]|nr:hypothetical protein [Verrucomicrobiota bacterium]
MAARLAGKLHGLIGLLLVAVFWPLNWFLPGFRTAYLFLPLWLGYILFVDALVFTRRGTSLYTRSRSEFWGLFVISAPAWWLFEVINWRTKNWEYLGGETLSGFEYFLLSSISFSTVMPAVFETAELARTFRWIDRLRPGRSVQPTNAVCLGFLAAGLVMLALTMAWPKAFYPLVWGSIVLILEPVNIWLSRQHFLEWLREGDWRPVIALALGALICGFFWEMWNFKSYPKWIYHTPGAEFLYVFEMPLLGFLGYLPFAWELFSLRSFLWPSAPRLKL